jgi:hypothetical protein
MIELATTLQPVVERRTFAARAAKWLSLCAFALLVYWLLFQLPFYFPSQQRLMSASYTYGFNNSVAILLTAGLLGAVTLFYLLLRGKALESSIAFPRDGAIKASRSLTTAFAIGVVCYAAVTLVMYLYNVRSFPWLMWETRHLLYRTLLMDLYGLRPYTEVSAEYGPILTYAPSYMFWLLRPLGGSHEQAYFASHLLLNLAGLWCVYYVLSRARMSDRARLVAFVSLAIAGFGLWMGVNGVLVRYLFPFASVLAGHRLLYLMLAYRGHVARWSGAVISVLLLLVANILLSPEIGLAFVLAWLGYAVLSFRAEGRILAVSLIALVAAALLCWAFLPPEYYGTLLLFSEGANNFPLVPAPHLVLYLVTLFVVVPPLLAVGLRQLQSGGDSRDAAVCSALGILCVVMAPGALGRCDPPHVLFYGMGASLLLMIRLANISWRRFMLYALAYAAVFIVFVEAVNLNVFYGISARTVFSRHPWQNVVQRVRQAAGTEHPDLTALSVLDRYPRLGLPFATFADPVVEKYVVVRGKLDPEYYVATVGVYNAPALDRKLREVGKMEYLLVPTRLATRGSSNPCAGYRKSMRQWFFYPARFRCHAQPLDPTATLMAFIADNYAPVEHVGSWSVLRRVSDASPLARVHDYVSPP